LEEFFRGPGIEPFGPAGEEDEGASGKGHSVAAAKGRGVEKGPPVKGLPEEARKLRKTEGLAFQIFRKGYPVGAKSLASSAAQAGRKRRVFFPSLLKEEDPSPGGVKLLSGFKIGGADGKAAPAAAAEGKVRPFHSGRRIRQATRRPSPSRAAPRPGGAQPRS